MFFYKFHLNMNRDFDVVIWIIYAIVWYIWWTLMWLYGLFTQLFDTSGERW